MPDDLREKMAEQVHAAWAHWMTYLFSQSGQLITGAVVIPPELVARWQRQIATPYQGLAEEEKASDRREAEALIRVFNHG